MGLALKHNQGQTPSPLKQNLAVQHAHFSVAIETLDSRVQAHLPSIYTPPPDLEDTAFIDPRDTRVGTEGSGQNRFVVDITAWRSSTGEIGTW